MHKLKSEVLNLFWSQKKKSENKRNTKDGVTLMLNEHFSELLILLIKLWFFIINLSTNEVYECYKRNPRSLDPVVTILVFPSHPGISNR